ncbi:ABC transporter permease [Alkaliphilus sp. MSJ-5]|uniref:ABC transporter permease n=1 Tax=Alkaliphilus flagellatus TaxID=2841507 RepID=A0ABS6G3I5_9FIRM|nr:ABC transporter permease [Alkaliphilus flagellatus]MBU5677048.1 ABC transporter permease [Alkaliphilus flagellatus]
MITLIRKNFKLFFKSIYLALGFFIFSIVVNVYLIEGIYKLSIHKDALYYLIHSQKISIIYFVFFVFISYEYLVKSKNESILECFSVINNGKFKLYFSKLAVLVIIIVIMTLNIMIYNYVAYFVMNVNSLSYAYHIFLNNFLNVFLVSFLGVCIGTVTSLYLKRFPAYLIMIFSTVLISPIFESVPYILFMGFEVNIYPLREIFNILPPNLDWVEEELYGLSIESYRWNLLIFWICFLSSFVLLKLSTKKSKLLNFVAIILLSFSLINLYSYTKPGSIVKKDYNPNSFVAFDELYYIKDVQKEENVEFNILAYGMDLTIGRQLHSDIKISLDEKEYLNSYKFTLYRNYKVEKILSKKNEILEFRREGDYLEVFNPTNEKLEEIRILYSGYSPVFYSNSQGVLLPGCFPYYPIEGYKKIYLKEQSSYIPIIRDDNIKFNVSTKSNLDIYSNLQKDNNNFFGEAQAVTLIGGFVEEKNIGNNIFYGLTLEKLNTNALLDINNILEPYKNMFLENEEFNITGKKIFQSPATFTSRVMDNGLVSFKDHIFIYGLDKENLVQGFLQSTIPQDIKKIEIKSIFFDYLLYKNRILNIPKEELENNKSYELHNLFLKKINELGENYVLKNTYDFLRNKNDTRDSTTFIRDLTKGGH